MRVVQLNEHLVRERIPALVEALVATDDVPERARDEEVLLAEAELLACGRVVVRIEDLGQVLGPHLARDGVRVGPLVEVVEVKVIDRLRAPEAKRVDGVAIADDRQVIGKTFDDLVRHPDPLLAPVFGETLDVSAEVDVLRVFRTLHLPRIAVLQPRIRLLDLTAVDDLLAENAVVIAETVAHAREVQRRHRVEIAGRETSEATVAEARVRLEVTKVVPVDAEVLEGLATELVRLQVDDVVAQETSDQELERHVVDALRVLTAVLLLRGDPALDDAVADRIRKRRVLVALGDTRLALRQRISEMPREVLFQTFNRHLNSSVLRLLGRHL